MEAKYIKFPQVRASLAEHLSQHIGTKKNKSQLLFWSTSSPLVGNPVQNTSMTFSLPLWDRRRRIQILRLGLLERLDRGLYPSAVRSKLTALSSPNLHCEINIHQHSISVPGKC